MSGQTNAGQWQARRPEGTAAAIETPDPRRPARLYRVTEVAGQTGRRWLAQRERQSIILAASRRQITDEGYDGVCLKHVARMCSLPKQTIYNIVGSRDEMIGQASAEWVEWLALSALAASPPSRVLAVLRAFWLSAAAFPDYTAQSVQASCSPASPLNASFRRPGTRIVKDLLAELARREAVRPSLDVARFAWQLTEVAHAGVCRWILTPYDVVDFRRDFAYGPGMMLLGALRGAEAALIDRELNECPG